MLAIFWLASIPLEHAQENSTALIRERIIVKGVGQIPSKVTIFFNHVLTAATESGEPPTKPSRSAFAAGRRCGRNGQPFQLADSWRRRIGSDDLLPPRPVSALRESGCLRVQPNTRDWWAITSSNGVIYCVTRGSATGRPQSRLESGRRQQFLDFRLQRWGKFCASPVAAVRNVYLHVRQLMPR